MQYLKRTLQLKKWEERGLGDALDQSGPVQGRPKGGTLFVEGVRYSAKLSFPLTYPPLVFGTP